MVNDLSKVKELAYNEDSLSPFFFFPVIHSNNSGKHDYLHLTNMESEV